MRAKTLLAGAKRPTNSGSISGRHERREVFRAAGVTIADPRPAPGGGKGPQAVRVRGPQRSGAWEHATARMAGCQKELDATTTYVGHEMISCHFCDPPDAEPSPSLGGDSMCFSISLTASHKRRAM